MPIYEYRCGECGAEFERLVTSATTVVCPRCAGSRVTRRLSLFRAVSARSGQEAVAPPAQGGGCCGGGCGCH